MAKWCKSCQQVCEEFYNRDAMCKECRKEYMRNYRKKKKDEKTKYESLNNKLENLDRKVDKLTELFSSML